MRLLLVEVEKLRTLRSTWLLLAAAVFGPLPIAIIALTQVSALDAAAQDVLALVLIPGVLIPAMAAVACAREFEQRTITTAFTLEPRRERVLFAKAAVAALIAVAGTVLFCVLLFSVTAIWLSSSGVGWPWSTGDTVLGVVGATIVVSTLAAAGTAFGGITRHAGSAITLLIVVCYILDAILSARIGFWNDYGTTAAANALTEPGQSHHLSFLAAAAIVTAMSALLLAISAAVVRRVDV